MGAWGTGVFDNDTACDWSYELEASKDLSLIERTLDRVVAQGGDVDSSNAEEALAAAETVARLLGRWGVRNSYTEPMDAWVQRMARAKPSPALVAKALSAIDRILVAPSEILEAWNDAGTQEKWRSGVLELRTRLESAPRGAPGAAIAPAKPWWRFW